MHDRRYRLKSPDGRFAGYGHGSHTVTLGDSSTAYVYSCRDDADRAAHAFGTQLGVVLSVEEYLPGQDGLRVGDRVRFRSPLSPEECSERFDVLELRGDRALVRTVDSGMRIVPTFVYLLSDLEIDQ